MCVSSPHKNRNCQAMARESFRTSVEGMDYEVLANKMTLSRLSGKWLGFASDDDTQVMGSRVKNQHFYVGPTAASL